MEVRSYSTEVCMVHSRKVGVSCAKVAVTCRR